MYFNRDSKMPNGIGDLSWGFSDSIPLSPTDSCLWPCWLNNTPQKTRLEIICVFRCLCKLSDSSPLGILLYRKNGTPAGEHEAALLQQTDRMLMAQQYKRRNFAVSYELSHAIPPSHCLQEKGSISRETVRSASERRGWWEEDVTEEVRKLRLHRVCSLYMYLKLNLVEPGDTRTGERLGREKLKKKMYPHIITDVASI